MPPGTASAQTIDPQSPSGCGKAFSGPLKRSPSFLARVSLLTCETLGRNHDRIRSDSKVRNFSDDAPGRIGRRNWRCRAAMEFFRYCRLTSPKPLLRNRATTSSVLKRFVNGAEGEAFIRRSVSRAPTINPCHATAVLASWPAVPGFPDPRTRPNAFTSRFPRERWFQAAPARAYCRSARGVPYEFDHFEPPGLRNTLPSRTIGCSSRESASRNRSPTITRRRMRSYRSRSE
jgi:hypothetical protein